MTSPLERILRTSIPPPDDSMRPVLIRGTHHYTSREPARSHHDEAVQRMIDAGEIFIGKPHHWDAVRSLSCWTTVGATASHRRAGQGAQSEKYRRLEAA
jgi:hypothetical protein